LPLIENAIKNNNSGFIVYLLIELNIINGRQEFLLNTEGRRILAREGRKEGRLSKERYKMLLISNNFA
jgi:hypothetical protein